MEMTEIRGIDPPAAAGWHETRLRVRYAETDQMGVVYHSNYLVWFETGRVEYFRSLGYSYREMEKLDGCFLAVVDAHLRYRAPARYDDLVVVRTRVTRRRAAVLHFGYEVVRESDGVLLATGETVHVWVDRNFEPTTLPERYQQGLEPA